MLRGLPLITDFIETTDRPLWPDKLYTTLK
jgi:hypothetical protein